MKDFVKLVGAALGVWLVLLAIVGVMMIDGKTGLVLAIALKVVVFYAIAKSVVGALFSQPSRS